MAIGLWKYGALPELQKVLLALGREQAGLAEITLGAWSGLEGSGRGPLKIPSGVLSLSGMWVVFLLMLPEPVGKGLP